MVGYSDTISTTNPRVENFRQRDAVHLHSNF